LLRKMVCTSLDPVNPTCETLLQECDQNGVVTPECYCCNVIDCIATKLVALADQMRNQDNVYRIIYEGPYRAQSP